LNFVRRGKKYMRRKIPKPKANECQERERSTSTRGDEMGRGNRGVLPGGGFVDILSAPSRKARTVQKACWVGVGPIRGTSGGKRCGPQSPNEFNTRVLEGFHSRRKRAPGIWWGR